MSVPGSVPATVGRRLSALLIDAVAALVLGGGLLVGGLAGQWRDDGTMAGLAPVTLVGALVLLAFALTQWAMLGTTGRTVGGLLTAQRVVDQDTGDPIGLGRAAVRCAVHLASWVLPLVGPAVLVVSGAWDPEGRRRTWHDRIARTVVLDLAVGLDPRAVRPGAGSSRPGGLLGSEDERRALRPARAALPVPRSDAADPVDPVDPAASAGSAGSEGAVDAHDLPGSPASAEPGAGADGEAPTRAGRRARARRTETPAEYDPWPTGEKPTDAYPGGAVETTRATRANGRRSGVMAAPMQGRIVPDAPREQVSSAPYRALEVEVEQTQLREARSKVAYAPTRAQTRPRATLLLWDNRVVVLDGTALVGRNPSPREGESLPVQVIAVLDRGRSVSKTHFAMGVDAEGAWLRDRSSTNGTIVTLTDGQQILCAPEQMVRVPVGASIAFGDYWLTVAG